MKRITIVAVLALFSAVSTTGCLGAGLGGGEDTDESEQSSGHSTTNAEDERRAAFIRGPQQTLELNLHPNTDSQGPHPEPWLKVLGPHPEPWDPPKASESGSGGSEDPNAPNGSKP